MQDVMNRDSTAAASGRIQNVAYSLVVRRSQDSRSGTTHRCDDNHWNIGVVAGVAYPRGIAILTITFPTTVRLRLHTFSSEVDVSSSSSLLGSGKQTQPAMYVLLSP